MNDSNFVRVGFVGAGTHSSANLYPVLHFARAKLVAVCDLNGELARRNAGIFGNGIHFTDVDQMLDAGGLDAVMVVGPAQIHYEVGRKALERGLHLFTEKPPAPDMAKAVELAALSREKGVVYLCGFMKRHGLPHQKARAMIASGEFIPSTGVFKYAHWPARDLRGMLLDMSSHIIDLAMSYFGRPTGVTAHTYDSGRALAVSATLHFASGQWAQLILDSSQPRIQERIELSGSSNGRNALLVIDNVQHMEFHIHQSSGIDLVEFDPLKVPEFHEINPKISFDDIHLWRPDYGIPNMGQTRHFIQGFANEVREFADAIVEKRPVYPETGQTLAVMRVIEAICAKPQGYSDILHDD
ncbi:Gfo/Idh/MocA family oxidoreductase [Oscillatoria laete-virens NRMC-F 0139]|nr:Gfo/Idh/MocA family oxidoreductase [Oscillatoria laete-virens]MDL5055201.1 Gfo/Idh/MocA family oxidoreductase [Oscillatoria laete-virens NRMC-F 0139]